MATELVFIVHVDHPRLGWLEDWARDRFDTIDVVYAHKDCLNDLKTKNAGNTCFVVMGGPMGVGNIPLLSWLSLERDFLKFLLENHYRVLGICLGAQLLAHCLGHGVKPCQRGSVECGYYPLYGCNTLLPQQAYQWHKDGIFMENDGREIEVLGYSDWQQHQSIQAFCYDNILGVQFHPEVDEQTISLWCERDKDDLSVLGAKQCHTHLVDHALYASEVQEWLKKTLGKLWGV